MAKGVKKRDPKQIYNEFRRTLDSAKLSDKTRDIAQQWLRPLYYNENGTLKPNESSFTSLGAWFETDASTVSDYQRRIEIIGKFLNGTRPEEIGTTFSAVREGGDPLSEIFWFFNQLVEIAARFKSQKSLPNTKFAQHFGQLIQIMEQDFDVNLDTRLTEMRRLESPDQMQEQAFREVEAALNRAFNGIYPRVLGRPANKAEKAKALLAYAKKNNLPLNKVPPSQSIIDIGNKRGRG